MRIGVYAICKDEEINYDSWFKNIEGVDEVVLCDTGSQKPLLSGWSPRSYKFFDIRIKPWRFDTARNVALAHLSEDIDVAVCLDLDERFTSPNWINDIRSIWQPGCSGISVNYVHGFGQEGKELLSFRDNRRIHPRFGCQWRYPAHELLIRYGFQGETLDSTITIEHHQDVTKKRDYLNTLAMGYAEYQDARSAFYLGRQFFYLERWSECLTLLQKFLQFPNLLTHIMDSDIIQTHDMIAVSYAKVGMPTDAIKWWNKTLKFEIPYSEKKRIKENIRAAKKVIELEKHGNIA